jgi:putative flippase GtrA
MTTDVASPANQPRPRPVIRPAWRQLIRFALIGLASTAAYGLLYLLFRQLIGPFPANAAALLITAVANTAANRRLTFGVRGGCGIVADHAVGLAAFGAGLALTTAALAGLHALTDPVHSTELAVLMAANALATVLRFGILKVLFGRR